MVALRPANGEEVNPSVFISESLIFVENSPKVNKMLPSHNPYLHKEDKNKSISAIS